MHARRQRQDLRTDQHYETLARRNLRAAPNIRKGPPSSNPKIV